MRITSKGQVTIPIEIRKRAGLLPEAEVDFVVEGQTIRIVRVPSSRRESRGARAVRGLRGTASVTMTTDQIMALTRKR
jgi:AbrB family looped-hinge helix DNA binding protein